MTNQVSVLESKIEVLQEQIKSIRAERYKVEEKFQNNLTTYFKKYFRGIVSEEINVECNSSSITFYRRREGDSYDKDIFNIYLRERWSREEKANKYESIELSYYTTNTQSDFELERLVNLGKVAHVVKTCKDQILEAANHIAKEYLAEMEAGEFYKRESEVEKQIRGLRDEIYAIKKGQKLAALFSEEGVSFEKGTHVRLKFNYEPRISKIRLVDLSKSGKKATALFIFAHHDVESREENVDVAKIVAQVI